MPHSLPKRWLEYNAFGNVIKGTKILALKVPLKQSLTVSLQPEQRFTVTKLLEAFPGLKCLVDLTNTYRYYDPQELTDAGIRYEKLLIPGQEVPPKGLVTQFFRLLEDLISSCGEDEIVGVHCTHGVNRTGYMICRYLVEQLNWGIEDSLKAFEEARGYPIERDTYVSALRKTAQSEKIETMKAEPGLREPPSSAQLIWREPPSSAQLTWRQPSSSAQFSEHRERRSSPYCRQAITNGRARFQRLPFPSIGHPRGLNADSASPLPILPPPSALPVSFLPPRQLPPPPRRPPSPIHSLKSLRHRPSARNISSHPYSPRIPSSSMPAPPPLLPPPPPPPPRLHRAARTRLPPGLSLQMPAPMMPPPPMPPRASIPIPRSVMAGLHHDARSDRRRFFNEQDFTVDTFEENLLASDKVNAISLPSRNKRSFDRIQ